jgi:hypothetical protein
MAQLVPFDQVEQALPEVRRLLKLAAFYAYDDQASERYERDLLEGITELWIQRLDQGPIIAAAVTGYVDYEGQRAMEIVALASVDTRYDWRVDLDTLKAHAAQMGASRIQFTGRPGWEKALKFFGFDLKRIEMHLALETTP